MAMTVSATLNAATVSWRPESPLGEAGVPDDVLQAKASNINTVKTTDKEKKLPCLLFINFLLIGMNKL
jgi:hypothetical protein